MNLIPERVVWNQEVTMPTFQIIYDDESHVNRGLQQLAILDGVSPETLIRRAVAAYLDTRLPAGEPDQEREPTNLAELFEDHFGKKPT